MSTPSNPTPPAAPVPAGYATVTPWIIGHDTAALLDFVTAAFDGEEIARIAGPRGRIDHAEIRIGDSVVMAFDSPEGWSPTPAFLRLYTADGDRAFRQGVAAGATIVTDLTELAWGDRVGRLRDPLGNVWWIQQRLAELTPDEVQRRMAEPRFIDAMRYVQSAAITLEG